MIRFLPFVLLLLSACRREAAMPYAMPVEEKATLRLLTFNVRYENPEETGSRAWSQRVLGAVRMIRAEKPDIIGVQEALHGQAADLRASLPDYGFIGLGRDDGKKAGEYSALFYRTDRFVPDDTDSGVFWLSATPEKPGSKTWGNQIPRIATWVRLIDRATGRGLYAFNTHWDHRNQPSREKAAILISSRIATRRHQQDPVIVLGDFNAIESNAGLKTLVSAGFTNAYPGPKNHRTTLHFWRGTTAGDLKVDHILVPTGTKVLAAKIRDQDQPMISDHFPVIVEIERP